MTIEPTGEVACVCAVPSGYIMRSSPLRHAVVKHSGYLGSFSLYLACMSLGGYWWKEREGEEEYPTCLRCVTACSTKVWYTL